jgi:hypothetical protein
MTLMVGLHHFFLEMSKKCWPRFRVRNSTPLISFILNIKQAFDYLSFTNQWHNNSERL